LSLSSPIVFFGSCPSPPLLHTNKNKRKKGKKKPKRRIKRPQRPQIKTQDKKKQKKREKNPKTGFFGWCTGGCWIT
jgi:hypothetical protein